MRNDMFARSVDGPAPPDGRPEDAPGPAVPQAGRRARRRRRRPARPARPAAAEPPAAAGPARAATAAPSMPKPSLVRSCISSTVRLAHRLGEQDPHEVDVAVRELAVGAGDVGEERVADLDRELAADVGGVEQKKARVLNLPRPPISHRMPRLSLLSSQLPPSGGPRRCRSGPRASSVAAHLQLAGVAHHRWPLPAAPKGVKLPTLVFFGLVVPLDPPRPGSPRRSRALEL